MKLLSLSIVLGTIINISEPQINWFRALYDEGNFFMPLHPTGPVIYREMIIAPGKKSLYGININSGRRMWTTGFPSEISSSPVVYNGRVFLSTLSGKIYIVKPENGEIIREVTIINSSITSNFSFARDRVLFTTDAGELIAIDINSGEILWSYRRKHLSDIIINRLPSPVIQDNLVFSGFPDGALVCLDLDSGKELWSLKLPPAKRFEGIYATPVIYKDKLIVPKYNSGLYSISISGRKILWAKEDEEGYLWCLLNDDSLYCASLSGKLQKINPFSGNTYWIIDFLKMKPSLLKKKLLILSPPAITNNIMYLSAEKRLYEIDLQDGKITWSFKPPGVLFPPGISSAPVTDGKSLIFLSNSGLLYNFKIIR